MLTGEMEMVKMAPVKPLKVLQEELTSALMSQAHWEAQNVEVELNQAHVFIRGSDNEQKWKKKNYKVTNHKYSACAALTGVAGCGDYLEIMGWFPWKWHKDFCYFSFTGTHTCKFTSLERTRIIYTGICMD